MTPKIATCSYCSTRAVLVMDRERHELSCRSCGAPLHDMKVMPVPVEKYRKPKHKAHVSYPSRRPVKKTPESRTYHNEQRYSRKPLKKRKSFGRWVIEELWDVVEDVFD